MPIQRILLFVFCIGAFFRVFPQITSTTPSVHACAPANITYTAPAGATNISWTFGSNPPSSLPSGGFSVLSPGTFSAIFSGLVNGSPVNFTVPVTIHAIPVANFTITQPSNSCAVKTVTLTDQSSGTAPIVSWYWIYGDGSSNTFANSSSHTYPYNTIGSYSITLQITDIYGCDAIITKGPVTVVSSPTAVITSNPPVLAGCTPTFNAVFSASNSLGTGLTYTWNFGNGQTSNQVTSSSISFTAQSLPYPVSLIVSANGCVGVSQTYVSVGPATLSVTIPGTVCLNSAAIATVISNQSFSSWNVANAFFFSAATPPVANPTVLVMGFTSPGLQTITINAGNSQCNAPTVTKVVFVEQVVANFTGSTPTVSCSSPFIVSYNNTSSPAGTTAQWSYANANSVTVNGSGNNPTFTLTQGSLNPYTIYNRPFTPIVTLTATSVSGCTAAVSKTIHSVQRPAAWFNTTHKQGCAPLSVTFHDSSIVFPSSPITSYTWNNGATPPVIITGTVALPPASNSVIPSQTFVYTQTGTYTPFLQIVTGVGTNTCMDVSFLDQIIVANPPAISFSVPPGPFCHNDLIQITNTSVDLAKVQHWHVESDNGYFSGCVSDPNPAWKFTHVGVHNFTLTGSDHDCSSSATAGPIIVKGPIGKARFETSCITRSVVTFSVELQEAHTAILNFGDNSTHTFTGNAMPGSMVTLTVAHTYSASGNYTSTLSAFNTTSGCNPSVYTMTVPVRNVQANFTINSTVCTGIATSFNASGSIDVMPPSCSRGYLWFVDNLPPFESTSSTFSTSFTSAGIHSITLLVKDVNSCTDTTMHTIRASSVTPQFSFNANSVCLSTGTVQITNYTPQTPDPGVSYSWGFGNGQTFNTTGLSVPIQTYMTANVPQSVYIVTLTATNSLGCTAKLMRPITITNPPVIFNSSQQIFCVPLGSPVTVSFTPQFTYQSYTINYGAGPTATAIATGQTSYTYNAGVHWISIRVKDAAGCENTGSFPITGVQTPTANFIFSSPNSTGGNNICSGKAVSFTNVSVPQTYVSNWNLGSGPITNTNVSVSQFYSSSSTSVVAISLSITTGAPANCSSSSTRNFTIYAFNGDFVASNTVVCLGRSLSFSISPNSTGLAAWLWSYGDATSSSTIFAGSNPPAPTSTTHIYSDYTATAAGYTSVSLIFWSGDMACKDGVARLIKVIKVAPDFKRNLELLPIDSAHCINIEDKFTNTSFSNSSQLSYTWNFDNGVTAQTTDAALTYTLDGVYQVSLTAVDENQCEVTTAKNLTIFPLPFAEILPNYQGYCPNATFTLAMTGSPGVNSGTWSPASGIVGSPQFTTATSTYTANAIASITGNYSLVVTNTNNCVSRMRSLAVYIVQPPKPHYWDTSVVIGEPIPLNVKIEDGVTYTWTPVWTDLNCTKCTHPISTSTVDIVYTMVMEDALRCSQVSSTYSVTILPKSSIDLPTAFTPNGDGTNDIIYADGWGIKKLNYLKIYNRWGQLVFESNDILNGWDGRYNGVLQNVDTYVYQVSVETYLANEPLLKSGTFKLIR